MKVKEKSESRSFNDFVHNSLNLSKNTENKLVGYIENFKISQLKNEEKQLFSNYFRQMDHDKVIYTAKKATFNKKSK